MVAETFEQACVDVERAATSAAKAANVLTKAAKQLERAAQDGDLIKLRKAVEAIETADRLAQQEASNATHAWPFSPEEEEALLRDRYEGELLAAAEDRGIKITRQDDRLIVYPSILRLLPEGRAVQVDRIKMTAIRPSKLADHLKANQAKRPRFRPEQFLESLYAAYKLVIGPKGIDGTTLALVYQALTLLPGASRDYDKSDFARDLYFLQSSTVTTTRSGARVTFPASTGTKGASQLFTFVGPDGTPIVYYGITFSGGKS